MASVTVSPGRGVGGLLRQWRHRRHLSQLDLAVSAEVSARHLSFIENGRSRPSRELVMHLAEHLAVPRRDCNSLLLAAGYAPVYSETPIDSEEMAPVRRALDKIVQSHSPFPAIVVNRCWDIVAANQVARDVLGESVAAELLTQPVNALRVTLHPDGMAPRIENLAQWASHLLHRLDRQIAITGDDALMALATELRSYPGIRPTEETTDLAGRLFVPLVLRCRQGVLRFFSTVATFGTALDITVAELAIESFFPADEATSATLMTSAPAESPSLTAR